MSTVTRDLGLPTGTLSISQLMDRREAGHMLPADFYLRHDIFETDVDVLYRREWLFVGVTADVPEAGDAFTVEVGTSSVIIVRGDDEVIRAFHNVCRHRASRLLEPGATTVGKLVCPYHQWTYELTGELTNARNMGKDFDRKSCGLRPVHLREAGGLLFICLADQAPDGIEELVRVMQMRLAPYDLDNARVAHEESIIEHCNWKLTVENNRECYHCGAGHPELTQSFPAASVGYSAEELNEHEAREMQTFHDQLAQLHSQCSVLGMDSARVARLENGEDTYYSTERYLIAGHGESATIDTRIASRKLLGSVQKKDLGDLNLWTLNSWHHFYSDHAVAIFITPLAADRTQVTTKWLVHKDAIEGKDYDFENLTKVWKATNEQDAAFVERQQRGISDPAYVPGQYSPFMETHVEQFTDWYLARLRAAGY